MADSPAHRFGQQVGTIIEDVVAPILADFCKARGLELDSKSGRLVSQRGRKVTWQDRFGNVHDLDYVVVKPSERYPEGCPVAFIEVAWRRYTKHSRNKAQEIQGALLPIAEKYAHERPFLGVVLAGVFTENSIAQMQSVGFNVLLFPYETMIAAFGEVGIDARFDESTPDSDFARTVVAIDKLSATNRQKVIAALVRQNKRGIDEFVGKLIRTVDRRIERIIVVPLFGKDHQFSNVDEALKFVAAYAAAESGPLRKFDVQVRFSNGDEVEGVFSSKAEVERFLKFVGT